MGRMPAVSTRGAGAVMTLIAVMVVGAGCEAEDSGISRQAAAHLESSASPSPIVATMNAEASLKENYPRVVDMLGAKSLVAVVRGTVAAVRYESHDGVPMTALTVEVAKTFVGDVEPVVTVREDGGFLRVSQVMAENADKSFEEKPDLDPDGWIDSRFENTEHLSPGDDVIVFLGRDPNAGRQSGYVEVSSVYGRFTLTDRGTFVRGGDVPLEIAEDELVDLVSQAR